jgi:prepilin-type N-terminal cleavage/methylation domain-containing protein
MIRLLKVLTRNFSLKQRGFTLIEVLIGTIISGVLLAISVPHVMGMYEQEQVRNSVGELQSTLQEARTQARRQGKRCTISLDTTNNQITSNGCLLESVVNLAENDVLKLSTNITGTPPSIMFSYKGDITLSAGGDSGIIVMSRSANTEKKRCILIPEGAAPLKTGYYEGSISPIISNNCITD